jgi:hypothetical protein
VTPPKTTADALARRDELLAQLAHVEQRADEHAAKLAEATTAAEDAERDPPTSASPS